MATKPQTTAALSNSGIPRTHGAAKKHQDYKKSKKYKFADLGTGSKNSIIKLADAGARTGSIVGIGYSPRPGYYLVGYRNERGGVDWRDWPIGTDIPQTEPA